MFLKRLAAGLIASAALISAMPAPLASAGSPCVKFSDAEKAFVRKMNAARKASLGDLQLDPELGKAARRHTWEMADKAKLYHTPLDKLGHRVTNWRILGENVGVGRSVNSLHKAFLDSAPHRANILYDAFNHVGVGVMKRDGRLWVTVIFESRLNPGSPLC